MAFLGIGVFWVVSNPPAARFVSAQTPTSLSAARPTKTLSGQTPAKDDTVVIFYPQDPDTLNPLTANDSVSEEFFKLSYEYLAQRRYDDPTKWEPLLAESWDFNRDKLEYTLHLRKGVKWHPMKLPNGKELPATEFTAADVKFTFDCLFNKYVEASHYRSYYEDSEANDEAHKLRMKVSLVPGDKYTVKMKWTKPYFLMDDWSLGSIFIIPRHVFSVNENGEPISLDVSSKEFANGFNNHWANKSGCGTGPLMLTKWTRDKQVEFQRNPNYWGQHLLLLPCHLSNQLEPQHRAAADAAKRIRLCPDSAKGSVRAKQNASQCGLGQGETRRLLLSRLSLHRLQPQPRVLQR